MSDEERIKRVEEAIVVIKDLLVHQSGRLDDYYKALKDSREDFDFKINALIDAQMSNEAEIRELKEVSKSHLERIEKLEGN